MIDMFSLDASLGQLIVLGIFTFALGIFAGMVGLALGAIRYPVLLLMGFNPLVAAGTNLGVSILNGTAASWPHWREGRVIGRVVLVIGLPTIIGALLGRLFADSVRVWVLLTGIGVIQAISAVTTFLQWRTARRAARSAVADGVTSSVDATSHGVSLKFRSQTLYGVIGLVIGILSGASGLVLAFLRIPVLINVLRMEPRYAVGTNNAISVLAGVFGFLGHAVNMNFDVSMLAVMGATGMIGSFIGAKQTGRVSAITMRLVIAILLSASMPIIVTRIFSTYPN
jgi:hypothetical protein